MSAGVVVSSMIVVPSSAGTAWARASTRAGKRDFLAPHTVVVSPLESSIFSEDLMPLVRMTNRGFVAQRGRIQHRVPVRRLVVPGGSGTVLAADISSWFVHPHQVRFDPRPE